jgi:hypothetical protein
VYKPVPRDQIADALVHLRELFRQNSPSNERERLTHERREVVTKNFLSNLFRTKEHPTLHTVLELADIFSLTLDGAHRLFGYNLEEIREFDLQFNRQRTHIIESYPFERDLLIDLPSQLGNREAFGWNAALSDLVHTWQTDIPIRALEEEGWQQPGAFYVHVGTEDSLGSSIPPGSVALVEPIEEEERLRPNPRRIYLLQFGNGYRCSSCVVTRGKLLLLIAGRNYAGPQEFAYPEAVRIVGRIRAFALSLPMPSYPALRSLPVSKQGAPLILPWQHLSLDRLFLAGHLRFQRPRQESLRIHEALQHVFGTSLSGRTERRYRHPTTSQPHVDALMQLTVANFARYTDALRAQQSLRSDIGRFSLQTLLAASQFTEVPGAFRRTHGPRPSDIWEDRRKEFIEWPTLLSIKFPQIRSWNDRVIRLSQGITIQGFEPSLSQGSLMVIDNLSGPPDLSSDARKTGWSRPIYALRRGVEFFLGHLDRDGSQFTLQIPGSGSTLTFAEQEFKQLSHISGVAVPV